MKKTLNVNLNGRVFTIDEDAYRLLESYLSNLRIYFRKEDGCAEIINDFEARIEELFSEKTQQGYQVITLEHVEEVIARVGKPTDFERSEENEKEKQTQSTTTEKAKKKFFRNTDNKVLGGVCSGIATYFDWNVAVLRIALIFLPFIFSSFKIFSSFYFFGHVAGSIWGWIIPAYIIAWIIIPAARTVEQKLQMNGEPTTVENIGKMVANQTTPKVDQESKGCISGFADMIVAVIKVFFIGLGCLIAIPYLFVLFVVIIVLIAVFFGVGGGIIGALPFFLTANHPLLAIITGIIVLCIPVFAMIYLIVAYFAKWKPMNQPVKWALLITWVLALIVFLFSGFKFKTDNDIWDNKWNWSRVAGSKEIRGNGIFTQNTIDFDEAVTYLETGDFLYGNLQIEQIADDKPSIELSGDENLVEQVRYELKNGRLNLSAYSRLYSKNNLKIILRTNNLKSIQMNDVARVRIDHAYIGEELEVVLKGVGSFNADSLYVNSLTVRSEGVGSTNISGKAEKAYLESAGVGTINALDLVSDTIYAKLEGVGTINCNPVRYFEGRSFGIGSILYKEEPENKNVGSFGIGIIRKK